MKDFAHEKLISNQLKGGTLAPKVRLRSFIFWTFAIPVSYWLRGQQSYNIFLLWWFDSCQSTHLVLNFHHSHPHRDVVIQSPQNINPAFCSLNLQFRECLKRPFFANFNFLLTDVARPQPKFSHSSTDSQQSRTIAKSHPSTMNHFRKKKHREEDGGISTFSDAWTPNQLVSRFWR